MSKKTLVRLEILIASPPTKKCKALMEMFESFLTEFPDELKLDIYYAGEPMTGQLTEGFKKDSAKSRKLPSAYVHGKKVASREIPEKEKIKAEILQKLKNTH